MEMITLSEQVLVSRCQVKPYAQKGYRIVPGSLESKFVFLMLVSWFELTCDMVRFVLRLLLLLLLRFKQSPLMTPFAGVFTLGSVTSDQLSGLSINRSVVDELK